MDAGSIDQALERIEAAVARIERAAARRNADTSDLLTRHEGLKKAVCNSLVQLDKLIEGHRG